MAKLIVRRGMRSEYYGVLSVTAVANGDELIVDRRRGMRASSDEGAAEAETPDRRSPAPRKWIEEDVLVVR